MQLPLRTVALCYLVKGAASFAAAARNTTRGKWKICCFAFSISSKVTLFARGRIAPVTVLAALPAFFGGTELVAAAFCGCHAKEGKRCLKEVAAAFSSCRLFLLAAFRGGHPKEGKQCLKRKCAARPVLFKERSRNVSSALYCTQCQPLW